jgi:BirA family biotin operon repressor/biotin-[acetyl-CoA-carboxylase] ligase
MIGRPRVHHRVTDSTNERAKELAAAPHGTLVTADAQTAGRGRQGRAWTAEPGHALLMSLVVRGLGREDALLPLVAAVAVCEACEATAGVSCAIKWPNDVWIEGRKAAGILIEGRPQERWAVLGIGLNVDTRPDELAPELRDRATSLRIATGRAIDRGHVLDLLLEALAEVRSRSDESVLSALRERDALYGRRISWQDGKRRLEGEARGIDEAGRLVAFDDAGARHTLDAGEVHLL